MKERERLEAEIRKLLGNSDSGPALALDGEDFVLFNYYDAPCHTEILAKGRTFDELADDINSRERAKEDAQREAKRLERKRKRAERRIKEASHKILQEEGLV